MPRLLITGTGGLLGYHVAMHARSSWQVTGTAAAFPADLPIPSVPLNFLDGPQAIAALVERVQPDAIIHCAAISEGRLCEQDPESAIRVNVEATEILARAVTGGGGRFIFVSTDQVFDGRHPPYDEASATGPIGWYARTKVMAEERVLALSNSAVVRTALLLGSSPRGNRSANERLALQIQSGESPRLFIDEFRSPLAAVDLAAALVELAAGAFSGVLHIAGPECLSRYALAVQLAEHFGWPLARLIKSSVRNFPTPRPENLCLDSQRAHQLLGSPIRPVSHCYPALQP